MVWRGGCSSLRQFWTFQNSHDAASAKICSWSILYSFITQFSKVQHILWAFVYAFIEKFLLEWSWKDTIVQRWHYRSLWSLYESAFMMLLLSSTWVQQFSCITHDHLWSLVMLLSLISVWSCFCSYSSWNLTSFLTLPKQLLGCQWFFSESPRCVHIECMTQALQIYLRNNTMLNKYKKNYYPTISRQSIILNVFPW